MWFLGLTLYEISVPACEIGNWHTSFLIEILFFSENTYLMIKKGFLR
jgi:hypothetical protein